MPLLTSGHGKTSGCDPWSIKAFYKSRINCYIIFLSGKFCKITCLSEYECAKVCTHISIVLTLACIQRNIHPVEKTILQISWNQKRVNTSSIYVHQKPSNLSPLSLLQIWSNTRKTSYWAFCANRNGWALSTLFCSWCPTSCERCLSSRAMT